MNLFRKYLLTTIALLAMTIGVPGLTHADQETWTFLLDGAQANAGAGTGSEATGIFFLNYDEEDGMLKIWGEHNVANSTAAHIHRGVAGQNGGVVHGFANAASPVSSEWQIDAENLAALRNGELYVNVHSQAFGGGEIRGQCVQTTTDMFEPFSFTSFVQTWQAGVQDTLASIPVGNVTCWLGAGRDVILIEWQHMIQNATAAHIHMAPVGENGGVVFVIGAEMEGQAAWFASEDEIAALIEGNLYFNIHTEAHPSGFARGQIIQGLFDLVPNATFTFMADGQQSATGSEATGQFFCTLNAAGNELSIHGKHNIEAATAAHIHRGAPGESGPVVFGFESGGSPIEERWFMSPEDIEDLMAGNLYVNIHSEAHAGGEIRGQLVMTEIDSAEGMFTVVNMDGAQANGGAGTGSIAVGQGFAMVNSGASVVYFIGFHTCANPTAAHIHRGGADANGGVMFGFDVMLTTLEGVWFPGEGEAADIVNNNSYVNVHTTAFGGGEIRGAVVFVADGIGEEEAAPMVPTKVELAAAYPNPFNSMARLNVSLPNRGIVELGIHDLAGREVARLVDGELGAGNHELVWDANAMPAGVYIARLAAGGQTHSVKLMLVK